VTHHAGEGMHMFLCVITMRERTKAHFIHRRCIRKPTWLAESAGSPEPCAHCVFSYTYLPIIRFSF
jgi:hypothetical protein